MTVLGRYSATTIIDYLNMGYNGNQLKTVMDGAPANNPPYGFIKPSGTPSNGKEYDFNKNGAMK